MECIFFSSKVFSDVASIVWMEAQLAHCYGPSGQLPALGGIEDWADESKHAWKIPHNLFKFEQRLFKLLVKEIQMYTFCPQRESAAFVLCGMHEYIHPPLPFVFISQTLCSLPLCICLQTFGQFALKHELFQRIHM